MTEDAKPRPSHGQGYELPEWELVERYAENFVTQDYRLVFRRGAEVLEIQITRDQFKAFERPVPRLAKIHV